MSIVKVSTKYQIVIPQDVREQSGLKPGDEVDVIFHGGNVRVVKVPAISEASGMFKGLNIELDRDKTDRQP